MNQVLFQHGTLALLVPGLLAGTMSIGELLQHGDTGIGTGSGLDGELIILEGNAYQISGQGQVRQVSADFTVPFADVHQAAYQDVTTVAQLSQTQTYQRLEQLIKAPNTFYSVKINGSFQMMHTRAAVKSTPPYKTLVATSQQQQEFTAHNITGTLLSYYSPQLFHGAVVAGFHSHFLAADHSMGGHVLDFVLTKGQVQVQIFDTFEQHLPIANHDFMQHDFSHDNIGADITTAE